MTSLVEVERDLAELGRRGGGLVCHQLPSMETAVRGFAKRGDWDRYEDAAARIRRLLTRFRLGERVSMDDVRRA